MFPNIKTDKKNHLKQGNILSVLIYADNFTKLNKTGF